MRIKYLKKNLNETKRQLKILAKSYKLQMKWEEPSKTPYIWVDFEKKISHKYKCVRMINLPAEKIAYGKYKPGMVVYNVERQIQSWLKTIPEL